MGGTDTIAFAFAVVAVAVGLGLTAYVMLSDGQPADLDSSTPRALRVPTLDVMLGGSGHSVRWRFESRLDETITVDVFSQRASGGAATATWRHDLMTEALTLPPGTTAELPAETGATRYDAAIGWYVGDVHEQRRESRFVSIERPLD